MRFNNFFAPIGLMALLPALPLVMADDCKIDPPPTKKYDIDINFCFYHDYGIVDVRLEIPGANLKPDHVELPAHVKANASPIHLDETYEVDVYFKNDWTRAHRWEASIPIVGPTLYVDLETRIVRSNCKLGLKLHITGTGILGRLDESINLTELDQDGIKFLAQSMGLCSTE
ncbi:uncharacterized protein TRIVIDRAFT_211280 [Trichoderma virens Gv29-8]|uniref:Uncharacterized protein n=1 Tax=Hypocrea virens (strain Gv29-8 / FGSC 10586) TaxID=413071 RepID=G9MEP8_HYPVG|nr:uncharacterized protein TRIVIDRAFT_211280 [Trichoderma virens Gv29-8]EHK26866.1 hypothetical protein TRIVIDRAFT_211280 [Trichoderma virens Gv29-8]UKZ57320.1 hypothetical protein TrVGV298_011173 [Trichoderma virens]UKZ83037.1 hypothetical protein TrVFT333_010838 [Trichoderma virens FT-333]